MKIAAEHISAIQSLGYTSDEARFLYIVATHSGYFVPRQFIAFTGASWGKRSQHFTQKLESRGHVTWREYQDVGGVYHLFSKTLYRERNLVERFFSKLKHFRRIATRYDKLADNFLAMVKLASMRLWLRAYESTA